MTSTARKNPYLGLHSFTEGDAALFFGRDTERDQLFQQIKRAPLTVLFGRSGLGKSSLLEAGVFPLLRKERYLPVRIRLDFTTGRLGLTDQVRSRIAEEIRARGFDTRPLQDGENLWEYFHRVEFWDQRNWIHKPVLVLDQFEEIFTLGRTHPDREESLSALADLAENRIPHSVRMRVEEGSSELPESYDRQPVSLILSLREDHLGQLENLKGLIPSIYSNRYRLTRMSGSRALEAVRGPSGWVVDGDVAKKIVQFVAAAAEGRAKIEALDFEDLEVEPALLSLMCDELTQKAGSPDKITTELLQEESEDVLRDFYERSVSDLGDAVRSFVEDRLLTSDGLRTTVALQEALRDPSVTHEAIDTLVDRRLLRREERLGIPHLEIIHDVLRGVIKSSRDSRLERQRLAAKEKALETDRLNRRRRFFIEALVTAALILIGLSWYFNRERQKAVRQRDLFLTTNAIFRAEDQRGQIGALIAAQAFRHASRNQGQTIAKVDQALRSILGEPLPGITLQDPSRSLTSVAFSPREGIIAAGSGDKKLRLWSTDSEKPFVTLDHEGPVLSVAFSRDGRIIASADASGFVRLWDFLPSKGIRLRRQLEAPRAVHAVAFRPVGRQLAWANEDGSIRFWNFDDPQAQPTGFPAHEGTVRSLAFGLDGSKLATGGDDGMVRLWNLNESGTDVIDYPGNGGAVFSVALSPDGKLIASAGEDERVRLWSVDRPLEPAILHGPQGAVTSVAFSSDGWFVASDGLHGAYLWSLRQLEAGPFVFDPGAGAGDSALVTSVAFSGDGKTLAAGSGNAIGLLHLPGAQRIVELTGRTNSIAFNRDGNVLVTGGQNGIASFDLAPPRDPRFISTDGTVWWVAISPDGQTLAAAIGDLNDPETVSRRISLWRLDNLDAEPIVLRGHAGAVYSLAFSPDGGFLVSSGGDDTVRLWGLEDFSKEPVVEFRSGQGTVPLVLFNREGNKLATVGGDRSIRVWDRHHLDKPLLEISGAEGRAISLAFQPDSRQLAAGGDDGTIRFWDVETGEKTTELRGHEDAVVFLAFHPDGKVLASAAIDETVRLWELTADSMEASVLRPGGRVNALAFSSDGKTLALGLPKQLVLWLARTEDLASLVCKVVPWNLSAEERQEYLGDVAPVACPELPSRPSSQQPFSESTAIPRQDGEQRKLALLVGIDEYERVNDLDGCVNDVENMRSLLRDKYGFEEENILILLNDQATRKGILDSFERHLIAQAKRGDIVVFHYSGHGSQMRDANGDEPDGYDESIVPHDGRTPNVFDIPDDSFNGLLELLSRKTENITFIFDSSHLGTVTRAAGKVRTVVKDERPPPPPDSFAVGSLGFDETEQAWRSEPRYVVLSGSRSDQPAHEYVIDDGLAFGAFTYFFTKEVRSATGKLTYLALMDSVVANISAHFPSQQPQVEGAFRNKYLFGDGTSLAKSFVLVDPIDSGRVTLEAGSAQGLTLKSLYDVYLPGTATFSAPATPIAKIEVVRVEPFRSEGKIISGGPVLAASRAVESPQFRSLLVYYENLARSDTLRKIKSELDSEPFVDSVVVPRGYNLLLSERDGNIVTEGSDSTEVSPRVPATDADAVARVLDQVNGWRRWFNVLSLTNEKSTGAIAVRIERVENRGTRSPFERNDGIDSSFREGEIFQISVDNKTDDNLFLALLDLSSDGSIGLLFPSAPGAQEILEKRGTWTKSLRTTLEPGRHEVKDILKVFATSTPVDFNVLSQGAARGNVDAESNDPLSQLLNQALRDNARGIATIDPHYWTTAEAIIRVRR